MGKHIVMNNQDLHAMLDFIQVWQFLFIMHIYMYVDIGGSEVFIISLIACIMFSKRPNIKVEVYAKLFI